MSELYRRFDAVREENRRLKAEVERLRDLISQLVYYRGHAHFDSHEIIWAAAEEIDAAFRSKLKETK